MVDSEKSEAPINPKKIAVVGSTQKGGTISIEQTTIQKAHFLEIISGDKGVFEDIYLCTDSKDPFSVNKAGIPHVMLDSMAERTLYLYVDPETKALFAATSYQERTEEGIEQKSYMYSVPPAPRKTAPPKEGQEIVALTDLLLGAKGNFDSIGFCTEEQKKLFGGKKPFTPSEDGTPNINSTEVSKNTLYLYFDPVNWVTFAALTDSDKSTLIYRVKH
jgi:hypothetical protein